MTSKLNRAKQKLRSWQSEYHNLRKMVQASRKSLEAGCNACDYDEAEGGLFNHCDACCRKITARLYSLLVLGEISEPKKERGRYVQPHR